MEENNFLKNTGAAIRKIRLQKNMSQFELALLCNFEKASMSRIESGLINTRILTLRKISDALGVHINQLFAPKP